MELEIRTRELESRLEREKRELDIREKEIQNQREHELQLENTRQQGQNERHTISQASSNTSIAYTGKERLEIPILKSQNLNDVDSFF